MQAKESFFTNFIDSIKSIEKYPIMAINSFRSVFVYFIIFLSLFSLDDFPKTTDV